MRSTPTLIVLVALLCAPVAPLLAQAPAAAPKPAPSAAPKPAPSAAPAKPASPPPPPALPPEVSGAPAQPQTAGLPTDERARAKALFERGVAAYEGARWSEALANFQEAFRLRPHPLVRTNIANCYDKLGKPIEALFHFEQFLASDVPNAAQRQEVVAAMERLRKQLGSVLLRVTPDGATAVIDGGEQRKTPVLEPLQLQAGDHSLEVRLEGYQTVKRAFTVHGGSSVELDVVLQPGSAAVLAVAPSAGAVDGTVPAEAASAEPAAPAPAEKRAPAAAAAPAADDGGDDLPTHVWIIGGASVAMLAGATITGILALGAESDFERYAALQLDAQAPVAKQAAHDDAVDAADRADTLAAVTDVLLVGAVAGMTTAVVLAVLDDGEEAPVQPSAVLAPGRAGVQLRGRF